MHVIENRFPTVAEANAAQQPPLCESYWWFEGLNFNRPVIACVNIGGHKREGAYTSVRFFSDGHNPVAGYREGQLAGPMKFTGPINFPA